MRQRNDTLEPKFVQVADPPFEVQPGETVEWESPIIGLTIIEELKPTEDAKAPKKTAAKAANGEEPVE